VTRLERTNTSEAVAAYIIERLFSGELRGGDRIDLDVIAGLLGVSRVPVRESLIQLERDGLVERSHYRRAFVADFDASTIREAFELYGMLSSLTNRRVAATGDPGTLDDLAKLDEQLARCAEPGEYERVAREFRRVVNLASSGNHLRALLRTFNGLVPAAARFSIEDALDEERAALHAEYVAIRSGSSDAAGAAAVEHLRMTADNAVAALVRRGVFTDGAKRPQWTDIRWYPKGSDG
jgi:DNA-binding GntR family transcriptional regulator